MYVNYNTCTEQLWFVCMYHSLAVEMRVDKPKEVPRGVHKCVHCVCLSPGTATWPGHTGDEVEGEKEEEGKEEEIKEDEKVEDERRRGERRLLCMYECQDLAVQKRV